MPRRSAGRKVAWGSACGQHAERGRRHLARFGVGRAPGHDDDALATGMPGQEGAGGLERAVGQSAAFVVGAQRAGGRVVAGEGLGHQRRVTGPHGQGDVGQGCQRGPGGRDLDELRAPLQRGPQPQEEDGQFLAQVAPQRDEQRRRRRLVDGGPGQPEHQVGREAVAQLGVHRVGPDHALGQLGPRVGGFVGETGAADEGDRARTAGRLGCGDPRRRRRQGLAPADGYELALLADARLDQAAVFEAAGLAGLAQELPPRGAEAHDLRGGGRGHVDVLVRHHVGQGTRVHLVTVDRLVGKAALVAEPAVVHRLAVDAEQSGQPVLRRLHGHPAADRAGGAGGLDLIEVPGAGREAIGRRGERADGADLHRVATEVGGERLGREGGHLDRLAPAGEVDEGLARHLVGEAGATGALDAALAVEQHEVRNGNGLLEVPLLLDEPALARTVGQGLVLERALAALVTHRAVERVVGQQELEHAVLRLLDPVVARIDHHAVGDRHEAGRGEGGTARSLHVDQAHAAHAHGLHARVVAEARDVGARPLGRRDEELALGRRHRAPVEREGERSSAGASVLAVSVLAVSVKGAPPFFDVHQELVTEHADTRGDRGRNGRAKHADGRLLRRPGHAGRDVVAQVHEKVQIFLAAVAILNSPEDALEPTRALTARRALAARLAGEEFR